MKPAGYFIKHQDIWRQTFDETYNAIPLYESLDAPTWCEQLVYRAGYQQGRFDAQVERKWEGLTEQERNDLEDYCEMIVGKAAFDAIEAKLKEKNA